MNNWIRTASLLVLGAALIPAQARESERGRGADYGGDNARSVEREYKARPQRDGADSGYRDSGGSESRGDGSAGHRDTGRTERGGGQNDGDLSRRIAGWEGGQRDRGVEHGDLGGPRHQQRQSGDNYRAEQRDDRRDSRQGYREDYRPGRNDSRARHYNDHEWRAPRNDHRDYGQAHRNDYRRDYRHDYRRDHRVWHEPQWRVSWSHGWNGHRYRAPVRYVYPRGYAARSWRIGYYVPSVFLHADYYVDYRAYRLAPPPYGCRWVRIDGDLLLIELVSGEIVDALYEFFYY